MTNLVNNKVIFKEQLIEWFESGCKPKKDWRVGTEHEKFAYNFSKEKNVYLPLTYEGIGGIKSFLEEIARHGWEKVFEKDKIIGLKNNKQSITLEPGGQIELSGAPLKTIHSACKETNEHLALLKVLGEKLNITLLGLGSRPIEKTDDINLVPKSRYKIMRKYMPKKGKHGLDMMLSTCTVQANLDFSSEDDMIKKTILAVKIQPVVTALFANSPLSEGVPNGYLSKRKFFWTQTDLDRCGILKIAFEEDFSFSKYIDYALKVPMYFIVRDNNYIDCTGKSFKDFMQGKLDILPNQRPFIKDWEDHLSTIFTEVRLKKFIEVRGADAGNWRITCALPAFWVGLLYDRNAMKKALEICKKWAFDDVDRLSQDVAVKGLNAKIRNSSLLEISKELINIAKQGLNARNKVDKRGNNETIYLDILEEIVESGKNPAEKMLNNYTKKWKGNINKLIENLSY